MKTTLLLYLTTLLLLWGFTTYAQKTPENQSTQKISAQNPHAKGVVIEHTIDDKGNTLIRKRGTLKPISSARKTYLSNTNPTNPTNSSASTATFQKSKKISSPLPAPAISEIRKIEQEIIAIQNSDKADKAIRINKLEKLIEKKKIEQALLRSQ